MSVFASTIKHTTDQYTTIKHTLRDTTVTNILVLRRNSDTSRSIINHDALVNAIHVQGDAKVVVLEHSGLEPITTQLQLFATYGKEYSMLLSNSNEYFKR